MTKRDVLDQYLVSMNEVENKAKGHFFSKDAMRFFKSRLPQDAYKIGALYYFVTSEQHRDEARLYTLRTLDAAGQVGTIGEFQEHETKARAKGALRAIVKGLGA